MVSIRPQFIRHTAVKNQPTFKGQGQSTQPKVGVDADTFVSGAEVESASQTPPPKVDSDFVEWEKQIQDLAQPASTYKARTTETELSKHYTKGLSSSRNPDTFGETAIEAASQTDSSNRNYLDTGFSLGMIKAHELPYTPFAPRVEHAKHQLQSALTATADVIRDVVPQLHGVDLLQPKPHEAFEKLRKAFAELYASNKQAKVSGVGLTLPEIQKRLPQVEKQEQS